MKYVRHEFAVNEYTIRSRLTIKDFSRSDQGIYKCICKNSMNTAGDNVEGIVYLQLEEDAKGATKDEIGSNEIGSGTATTSFHPRGYEYERVSGESTTFYNVENNQNHRIEKTDLHYPWQERQTTAHSGSELDDVFLVEEDEGSRHGDDTNNRRHRKKPHHHRNSNATLFPGSMGLLQVFLLLSLHCCLVSSH
eukprot:maker-scaffold34_size539781-snap-gene-4.20 protein:Tk05368 transcript:maker-scaffold34_size539781-snap-gene-4.20-mRNA-1 annotation:"hypothetical protein SINV_08312"